MSSFEEILESKKKPKEIVELLAGELKRNGELLDDLIRCFENGTTAVKGNCMEAIEHVTKETPEFAGNCLDFVIAHTNDEAPRVKWEACRIIGNVAHRFPERTKEAVPALLKNVNDKGTVVRWSAAFALTEIAKNHPGSRGKLVTEFRKILEKETNNGVRNIYLKYVEAEDAGA